MHWLYGGKGFAYPDYKPRWLPDPPFQPERLLVDITLSLEERSVTGRAVHRLRFTRKTGTVTLHAADMDIRSVKVNGAPASYSYDGSEIEVSVDASPGDVAELEVEYSAKPRRGIWFVPIDGEGPARMAYTQGEPEDNRYWVPGHDYPNRKAPAELVIRVKEGLTVVANGVLVSRRKAGEGLEEWRFSMDRAMPHYLLAFAVGDFHVEEDEWEGVKLRYIVPRGKEALIERSFSKTPRIMEFLSRYTGVKYPYPKYDQVALEEFQFGGMENTAATFLTDLTLHDETAHREYRSEPLVAHEMAHQWFGDLVTCKDWSQLWLNEGFATLMEALWAREELGEEEFQHNLYGKLRAYLSEASRYTRPIVERRYHTPNELFDAHSYPKAALVLWALANLMGEDAFRRGLKIYLERHADSSADSEDLKAALEEASGLDLDEFFDKYVYSAGHPVVEYTYKWDADTGVLEVTAEQKQGGDAPTYTLALEALAVGEDYAERFTIHIDSQRAHAAWKLPSKPLAVCLDPDFKAFAVLKPKLGVEALAAMLKHCPTLYAKEVALTALAEKKGERAASAAAQLLRTANHWGLRADAARALAKIGGATAKKALLEALNGEKDARVRTAIAEALGSFQGSDVWEALSRILHDQAEGYWTRAAAATSIARSKHPNALEELRKALSYDSHAEAIRRAALRALAMAGGDEAFADIEPYTRPGTNYLLRAAAAQALGYLKPTHRVLSTLSLLAKSRHRRVRGAVATAAATMLDDRLLPLLQELQRDPDTYRPARDAAEKIKKHWERGEEYRRLREELDKLRGEHRELYERFESFEKKWAAGK